MRQLRALLLLLAGSLPGLAPAAEISPLPSVSHMTEVPMAAVPFDLATLKRNWRARIEAMRATGVMPLIDIESNLGEELDMPGFARQMDSEGVALIAFSGVPQGRGWSDAARYAVAADPWRYIPTGDGGLPPDWKRNPEGFAKTSRERIVKDGYPLMGEYEFRHYPSPDQIQRGRTDRDEHLALDSPAAHLLFQLAAETGIPFQIHQEIEDQYLPVLEKMLSQYPKARVIWCHLAQMRYQERNTIYGAAYVRSLIERHPNLYFDLFSGPPKNPYPLSNEYPGKYWNHESGQLLPEWSQLIADHPWRFMIAFDLNPFIMKGFANKVRIQRAVLAGLPEAAREIVAYKAAWKLLFGEEI
ncbi:MAG: amidohydrolase [Rhodocyclales bacterium]|nr:amidohydrolase [Rhodocyclales bacterium]